MEKFLARYTIHGQAKSAGSMSKKENATEYFHKIMIWTQFVIWIK